MAVTRYTSLDLITAAWALPAALVLGILALRAGRAAQRRTERTIGRVGGAGATRLGRILGGLGIAVLELQMTAQDYITSIWQQLQISDIGSGLSKTIFFGLEIAAIGCYNGLQVEGGAASVGRATTRTVVLASISILVSDFFLTKLFLAL